MSRPLAILLASTCVLISPALLAAQSAIRPLVLPIERRVKDHDPVMVFYKITRHRGFSRAS